MKAKPAPLNVICFLVANHPKMYYLKATMSNLSVYDLLIQQFELNSAQCLFIYLSPVYFCYMLSTLLKPLQ